MNLPDCLEKTGRVEIHGGPDERGRYRFTLYWMASYHPGHPDGENRDAERGQEFHCSLKRYEHLPTIDHREGSG